MKTVKKMTTSGAFVMTENAKVWASFTNNSVDITQSKSTIEV